MILNATCSLPSPSPLSLPSLPYDLRLGRRGSRFLDRRGGLRLGSRQRHNRQGLGRIADEPQLLGQLDVPDGQVLAHAQAGDIDLDRARDVHGQTGNLNFTLDEIEQPTFRLHPHGDARQVDRNLHGDLVRHVDAHEIRMDELAGDGVPLHFPDHHGALSVLLFSEPQREERVGPSVAVEDGQDLARLHGHGHRPPVSSVNDAGDEPLAAKPAGLVLPDGVPESSVNDDVFEHVPGFLEARMIHDGLNVRRTKS